MEQQDFQFSIILEFYFDRTNKFQNNTPYTFKFSNINPLYIFIISLYFCCWCHITYFDQTKLKRFVVYQVSLIYFSISDDIAETDGQE